MEKVSALILQKLGWNPSFAKEFKKLDMTDCVPARVTSQSKYSFQIHGEYGYINAKSSGKISHDINKGTNCPVVGDWVAVKLAMASGTAVIEAVLPRKSSFSRKVPGNKTKEQVEAANIDLAFIVNGLDGGRNLNLRRIERYLTLSLESGVSPVIVLNKADLCTDVQERINEVKHIAFGIPVHTISATEGQGLEALKEHFVSGATAVFLGPSGVGKSSIINALLGEKRLRVGEIRNKDLRGRHTTSRRELFLLPGNGAVIDTPGIREIQLWADESVISSVFPDIEEFAGKCKFGDCSHRSEPKCAVKKAIDEGMLDSNRFESYVKLKQELHYLDVHKKDGVRIEEKLKWKKISQLSKKEWGQH
ncbi:ribosome small subunit-dependent GTPase A [Chloroflexota bacterium]